MAVASPSSSDWALTLISHLTFPNFLSLNRALYESHQRLSLAKAKFWPQGLSCPNWKPSPWFSVHSPGPGYMVSGYMLSLHGPAAEHLFEFGFPVPGLRVQWHVNSAVLTKQAMQPPSFCGCTSVSPAPSYSPGVWEREPFKHLPVRVPFSFAKTLITDIDLDLAKFLSIFKILH